MKKRIGIDARFYSSSFTGIGRYAAELIKNLARLDGDNEYVIFLNEPQYSMFEVPNERFKKVRVNAAHYSFAEQVKFLYYLYREKLDLMHFTHFNAPMGYVGKTVVTIHDLILEFYPGKKMTSWLHRMGYRAVIKRSTSHAEHILSVSEHTARDLRKYLGVPREKITVTHNGIGGEFKPLEYQPVLDRVRGEYKLDRPFLLYTGVWRTHKNLVRLLRAFARVRGEMGKDVLLVLTGKLDPVYDDVPKMIEQLDLGDYVRRVGLVPEEDLLALYTLAEVYVFPSLYEGFGLPPLEAMACGTPVVTSNRSSMPEVCGEGNAIFFDPENVTEMAEKINLALEDEELRRELREKGLRRAKEFDWEGCAEQTLEVYKKVLGL